MCISKYWNNVKCVVLNTAYYQSMAIKNRYVLFIKASNHTMRVQNFSVLIPLDPLTSSTQGTARDRSYQYLYCKGYSIKYTYQYSYCKGFSYKYPYQYLYCMVFSYNYPYQYLYCKGYSIQYPYQYFCEYHVFFSLWWCQFQVFLSIGQPIQFPHFPIFLNFPNFDTAKLCIVHVNIR